jgi:glycosyltransferase involved in cell wall biosynthesis
LKIAFLITKYENASARYRVLQYLPYLNSHGVTHGLYAIPTGYSERLRLFRKLRAYDLIFLQRKLLDLVSWKFLRRNARQLVYDFDDAVMFRDSKRTNPLSAQRQKRFDRTVRGADMVIAGNSYLRDFAIRENLKTVVIPTSVDMERYTEKKPVSSHNVVIGWIGSRSTLPYLERIKSILDDIALSYSSARLKIVADDFFECEKMPVIKKQWSYEDEIADLHTFDIGLMPLTDDPWSRGKCGFKLLQYMAVGVPVVCSPVGVNREIVSDGIDGFHAGSDEDWIEKIGLLIRDADLRLQMGKRGREKVKNLYSVELNKTKLLALLTSLSRYS